MDLISSAMPIIVSLLIFSILVMVHEFGHFIVAKKSGIFVEEFAIGMGPLLLHKKIGETVYSIRVFPIGGFCKMLGEDEGCTDKRAFNNKSVFARIAVIVAGPLMNFILAFIITFFVASFIGFVEPSVSSIVEASPAQAAGIQVGDRVIAADGQKVNLYDDFRMIMYKRNNKSENIDITVKRGDQKITYNIIPKFSEENGEYIIGFSPQYKTGLFQERVGNYAKAGIIETAVNGYHTMFFYVKATVSGFIDMITFKVKRDEMAGPIGIVKIVGDSYETGMKRGIGDAVLNLASIAAILNVNLGVVNLFPIPALDGGRLLFLIIEAIRRKPVNREREGLIHFVGFTILMVFMCFLAYNDISRIFFN